MPLTPRGGSDIDQIRLKFLSGGLASEKLATTTAADKADGDVAAWSGDMVVDSGVALASLSGTGPGGTHPEILVDSGGPVLQSDGDFIYVLGVPN